MCDANLPSVSCVSVQSSNTSERVRRPQSDAISEYVHSGANQNLNRPCLPHVFPDLKKIDIFPFTLSV